MIILGFSGKDSYISFSFYDDLMFYLNHFDRRLPCLLVMKVIVFGLTEAVGVINFQSISLSIGLPPVLPDMKALIPFHITVSYL